MELEALQEIDSEVRSLGVRMLIITPELERYTRGVHRKLQLTFDVLTDRISKRQNNSALFLPCRITCDLYKSFGSTLDRFHDETEYRLPMPARYIIDSRSIIRAADVNADYTI